MNICEYRRLSTTEMGSRRLRAPHATLLEVSVWESFGEKHWQEQ